MWRTVLMVFSDSSEGGAGTGHLPLSLYMVQHRHLPVADAHQQQYFVCYDLSETFHLLGQSGECNRLLLGNSGMSGRVGFHGRLCIKRGTFPLYLCRRFPVDARCEPIHVFPLPDDGRVRTYHSSDAPSLCRDAGALFCHLCLCHEALADTLLCHLAFPDGGGAQCRGFGYRHFCLCQLVAGETAALHHPFCAGCPSGQSAVFGSVCPSGLPRTAARKRQFRGFPLGFYPIKGQVSLQATLVAMKDITGSTIWICMGSVLFVLCVPYYKQEKT